MRASPLQLRKYHLVRLALDADREHDAKNAGWTIDTSIRLGWSDDQRNWGIMLEVVLRDTEEGKRSPYKGGALISGHFEWTGDILPWRELARLVGVNGTSMLFGIIRELILDLSSRGPNGPMLLQTVNFTDLDPGEGPAPGERFADASPTPRSENTPSTPRASKARQPSRKKAKE